MTQATLESVAEVLREAGATLEEAMSALERADAYLQVLVAACEARRQDHVVVILEDLRERLCDDAVHPLEERARRLRATLRDLLP